MHWDSLVATVSMVRGLPQVSADPSFVGKVLDRVRAYEAGRIELEPVSESASGLWGRLRARFGDLVIPVPVRMAGALAIGAVVGILITGPDRVVPHGDVTGTGQEPDVQMALSSSSAMPAEVSHSLPHATTRPFMDLVDELALSPETDQDDIPESDQPGRFAPGTLPADPMGPGRQVHLDEVDVRPQITF